MHLHELLGWPGPMTHRQFLLWDLWQREQLNQPSRSDHYLMQIALYILRSNSRRAGKLKLEDVRLAFGKPGKGKASRLTPEESKARWLGHVAPNGNLRIVDSPDD